MADDASSTDSVGANRRAPPLCRQCARFSGGIACDCCTFCDDDGLDEIVLCDLNREDQEQAAAFHCGAFQPALNVISEGGERQPRLRRKKEALARRVAQLQEAQRNRNAMVKALLVQKAKRNPDEVSIDLRYHFVWTVVGRRRVLEADLHRGQFEELLAMVAIASVRRAGLLWLAADHLHGYFDSDGSKSADYVIRKLGQMLEKSVLKSRREIAAMLDNGHRLWADTYFVETVG